ncbi:glycosyltransferase family 2 protein [Candidatus Azambacteria bacterium]|nr:glycosyltransferase family 2 protein [Candidatus Azambacteria bacterium]
MRKQVKNIEMISGHKETNSAVAILMSVRDEESYIDLNIQYHLDLGFDYIFITNHCSTDATNKILNLYKDNPKVILIEENDPAFDHAKIINRLLDYANSNFKIDWFIFLDADEFLAIRDKNIHGFISRLDDNRIPYATIGWANALFDLTLSDYTCSPANAIDTMKYYYPWPEKEWQEYGHFRKALVKNHKNIEYVVGGHYAKTENGPEFFRGYTRNPFIVSRNEAKILHFEFRDSPEAIYKKWEKLGSFEKDSTSDSNALWLERIRTIGNMFLILKIILMKSVSDGFLNTGHFGEQWCQRTELFTMLHYCYGTGNILGRR